MGFFDKLKKITTNLFSSFTEADEAFFEELEETLILADLGMDTALDAVEKLRTRVRKEKLRDQSSFTEADEAFFEELEETLILADLGMDTALDAVEKLRTRVRKEKLRDQEEVREALREVLMEEMAVGDTALDLSTSPSVVLFIGVNGVGKTTSIGKLAHRLKGQGKRVLLCAADTFRAAAADQLQIWAERAGCELIRQHEGADPGAVLFGQGKRVLLCAADTFRAAAADQLQIWAERAGCELIRQHEGADPGAVLFDALQAAKARNVDVVLCDTAGRLHNKANLMAELHKLSKIIDRECPGAARETLLVLDATTGQNGLIQARTFQETAGLTGIVLTKLDGTAKGGIVVAIAKELGVPVKLAGVGEGIDDLKPFDAREYVSAII